MSNEVLRCNNCGSTEIIVTPHSRIGKCKSCGAIVILPDLENHETLALLEQAFIERNNYEFDKAISIYNFVLEKNPNELAAYEGILLSKYGIVYVFDKKTNKKIPTCHRYNSTTVFEDEDYLSFLDNCVNSEERDAFEQRAGEINLLQKGISEQLKNEKDFDVFISCKIRDENGATTRDAVIARDLYDELTKRGFKVFLSSVTLVNRISVDYEPIIYRALHSSKFFILVSSSKENVNSSWVRNEWSRYIDRIKDLSDDADRNSFICVYETMNPNDMPRINNRPIQCVNSQDLSYRVNVCDYICKIVKPAEEQLDDEMYRRYFEKYDKKRAKELEEADRKVKEAQESARKAAAEAEKERKELEKVRRQKAIATEIANEKLRKKQEHEQKIRSIRNKRLLDRKNGMPRKRFLNFLNLFLFAFPMMTIIILTIISKVGSFNLLFLIGLIPCLLFSLAYPFFEYMLTYDYFDVIYNKQKMRGMWLSLGTTLLNVVLFSFCISSSDIGEWGYSFIAWFFYMLVYCGLSGFLTDKYKRRKQFK